VKFNKPPLSFPEQAALVMSRGLACEAKELADTLEVVNYYGLSAYWHPFRGSDDSIRPGTTFAMVWRRHALDRHLRLLAMDAIERVEIAVRTQLVNAHALQYGPFGYEWAETLPGLHPGKHKDWVERIRAETLRNRRHEPFVNHYFSKYDEEQSLPVWMACELMSFGALLTFFHGAEPALQKKIAGHFGVADKVMSSWSLEATLEGLVHPLRGYSDDHAWFP